MREEDPALDLIKLALNEDLSDVGDITSRYFVPEEAKGTGRIFVKDPARLSGLGVASRVFGEVDSNLAVNLVSLDGSSLQPGDTVLTVEGSLRSILTAERTALNFLQRLSGVASLTATYAKRIEHTAAKLLDTRKTTPGWRLLEKQAVADGGGHNHRMGLYDHVMVKDNHLLAESGLEWIQASIHRVKRDLPQSRVQLEADTLEQARDFLGLEGVDSLLLDNMGPDLLRDAVALRDASRPEVLLEASGGVTLETIAAIAESGVDFISVGALTHSATAVDFSLELEAS